MSNNSNLTQSDDQSIFLQSVSVEYNVPTERIASIKDLMVNYFRRKITYNKFLALNDISFSVKPGEVFGIIGPNGAGKSTLLKVVSRVMVPTSGRVWIKGRVSPLLELGAGFHPELTGVENIFLNGTLLGYSYAEIEEKFHEIIEFADIGDFIYAPIRSYSSGMVARLGFAIATAWQPEVLILDEVLSVGDTAFEKKCSARINEFRENKATILLVSHSVPLIRSLCQRAILLQQGKIVKSGTADEVCDYYSSSFT